jgi:hypothetical protein
MIFRILRTVVRGFFVIIDLLLNGSPKLAFQESYEV